MLTCQLLGNFIKLNIVYKNDYWYNNFIVKEKEVNLMGLIREIVEWIVCIIIALVLAFACRHYVITPTVVKQSSMYPTLETNERVLLNRTFRITKKVPQKGDIITFEAPTEVYTKETADQTNPVAIYKEKKMSFLEKFVYRVLETTKLSYIKRLIALEGDHVEIKNGKVWVNGEQLEESYLANDVITESEIFYDFVVPEGYFFAIGDNRGNSVDCRHVGCIPLEKLEGIATVRWWPFDKFTKF